MPFGAVIGAVAGIGGALISADAAGDAADQQADSAADANALQKYQYDTTRADNKPALDARNQSLARLSLLLGLSGDKNSKDYGSLNDRFTGANLASEPGYQFGLQQGQLALDSSAAARGGLYSGTQLKAATRYGNDYASTKYTDAYNRFNSDQDRTFNRLSGFEGTGQTGFNAVNAAGQNYANQASENLIGAGNARGAATIAGGNAWGGVANQLGAIGQNWWQQQQQPGVTTLPGYTTPSYGTNASGGYTSDAGSIYGSYVGGP